jgi:hypothetical protein
VHVVTELTGCESTTIGEMNVCKWPQIGYIEMEEATLLGCACSPSGEYTEYGNFEKLEARAPNSEPWSRILKRPSIATGRIEMRRRIFAFVARSFDTSRLEGSQLEQVSNTERC